VAGGTLVTLIGLGFSDLGARVGFVGAAHGTSGNTTTVTVPASLAFGAFRGRALTCRTPPSPTGGAGATRLELSLNGELLPPSMTEGSSLRFHYSYGPAPPLQPSHVVSLRLIASGTVDDYPPSVQAALGAAVAANVGVHPSQVTVTVEAASVAIIFRIALDATDGTTSPASVVSTLEGTFSDATAATAFFASVEGIPAVTVEQIEAPALTMADQGSGDLGSGSGDQGSGSGDGVGEPGSGGS